MLYWWWLCAICVICHLLHDGYKIHHFFVKACWYGYRLVHWSYGNVIGDGSFSSTSFGALRPICLVLAFFVDKHVVDPYVVKLHSKMKLPNRVTCLDHILSKSAAWQSPPTRGTRLNHIWSKSAVRQSPLARGTFWATFGWSPLRDKSFDEGHNLDLIWLKSAAWQSPPMRGTIWTTFGQSLQWDKVLQRGASFFCHIWPMSAAWQVLLMTNHGHHSLATSGQNLLCDTSSNEGHFLCQIWPTPAARYATLISHCSFFLMSIARASQPTLPTRPLIPRGLTSWELPTKFSSLTTSWIVWLGAPIPYQPLGLSTRDLYVPNSCMPLRSISIWLATPLPSLETHPTKWASSVWSRSMLCPSVSFLISRIRQLWMPVSTMEMTCPWTCYPKPIGKISRTNCWYADSQLFHHLLWASSTPWGHQWRQN